MVNHNGIVYFLSYFWRWSRCKATWRAYIVILTVFYILMTGNYYLSSVSRINYRYWYFNNYSKSLDLIHFHALYPPSEKYNQSEVTQLRKQQAIGICINFNYEPDVNGNTLSSLLQFYTAINEHVTILTPSPFENLSIFNQELLVQYNATLIPIDHRISKNGHLWLANDSLNVTSTVHHIECANGKSGHFQQKCISLCAQLYARIQAKYSSLRGALYIADDLYFNFAYVFSHPERFSMDEVWTTPWLHLVDIVTNDKGIIGNPWCWWNQPPEAWDIFKNFFSISSKTPVKYRRIFQTLYGRSKRLAVSSADLLYLPFSDNQLTNFISVTNELMSLLPDTFCEIIISLLVDATMALSGHWAFENDGDIYNFSANRLNNILIMREMERTKQVKNARDPYSSNNSYRRRPCLFNPDAFIWDNRLNRQLFETAIINGTVPRIKLLKPWPYQTEFVHPLKLSNAEQWPFQLWHQGMQDQIQQLKNYQKEMDMQPLFSDRKVF